MDELIREAIEAGFDHVPRNLLKKALNFLLEEQRRLIKSGNFSEDKSYFSKDKFKVYLEDAIKKLSTSPVKRVINATGTVIHTNLGRAPLSEKIIDEIKPYVCNYSDLEFDLSTGKRGSRLKHIKPDFFNAESIIVVNNNASACMLILNSLANERDVIISRGELVEIGGSFRIPEIMKASGATLKEIGTTNRTHIYDYEKAINERTGLILKVHRSNFVQKGFISDVSSEELVMLSKKYGIPFYYDAGSGCLPILKSISHDEPIINEEVSKGVDIISFSGDKLLGGTQAGIIVGKKEFIDMMKKNPLYRALRPDKFTIYYLERLFDHLNLGDFDYSPAVKMLIEPLEQIKKRAKKLFNILTKKNIAKDYISIARDASASGGGSLPEINIPTFVLKIKHPNMSDEKMQHFFMNCEIPIIVRKKEGYCILDLKTVKEDEISILANAILEMFTR